jgi:hypothetical protein
MLSAAVLTRARVTVGSGTRSRLTCYRYLSHLLPINAAAMAANESRQHMVYFQSKKIRAHSPCLAIFLVLPSEPGREGQLVLVCNSVLLIHPVSPLFQDEQVAVQVALR